MSKAASGIVGVVLAMLLFLPAKAFELTLDGSYVRAKQSYENAADGCRTVERTEWKGPDGFLTAEFFKFAERCANQAVTREQRMKVLDIQDVVRKHYTGKEYSGFGLPVSYTSRWGWPFNYLRFTTTVPPYSMTCVAFASSPTNVDVLSGLHCADILLDPQVEDFLDRIGDR